MHKNYVLGQINRLMTPHTLKYINGEQKNLEINILLANNMANHSYLEVSVGAVELAKWFE